MSKGPKATEQTLSGLLEPGIKLTMPPYQRSYSWDRQEVRALLNDLLDCSRNRSIHFIGAIVLVQQDESRYLIVDGQQRLTTLTMMLCALRDLEEDPERAASLQNLIASVPDRSTKTSTSWRLSLNHIDGAYFRAAFQAEGGMLDRLIDPNGSESQQRMADNAEFIVSSLQDLPITKRRDLAEVILERLILVRVVVGDWDDGYRVFRVLNTRGKAPSSHDIIKTELLERSNLNKADADHFSRVWSEHEARLGGAGLDDLLSQIRTLYNRNAPTGPTGFRKAVLNKINARKFLAEELPAYVNAYAVISGENGNFGPHGEAVHQSLNHLRMIDHQLWRAPALRFLVDKSYTNEQTETFFRLLERFAFAMMLVVTERKQRLKRYGRIADAVDRPTTLLSARGPLSLSRDENSRMANRLLGRFGSFSQRRAIALRLNAALEGGRALGPGGGATVEHILPRILPEGSSWSQTWPSATVHRELCETIGNFALLSQATNQQADNAPFTEKQKLYFQNGQSEYALTADLRNRASWTPDDVRTRTRHLADVLLGAWDLDKVT
ncbi:MAG: DUF262 domain-containing protein [Henriciella sp.]